MTDKIIELTAKDFKGDSGGFDYRDYMSEPKKYTR